MIFQRLCCVVLFDRVSGTGLLVVALALSVMAAGVFPQMALAQQAVRESVTGRSRPEYDPIGIQFDDALRLLGHVEVGRKASPTPRSAETLGSFTLFPVMELEELYDDNIFRTNTGAVSDFVTLFRPSLRLSSDWANHALNFTLGGEIARNASHASEDYEDFNAGVNGKIDVDKGESVKLGFKFDRGHDKRGSLEDTGAPTPTKYYNFAFNGSYTHDVGDIASTTTATATRTDYLANGGNSNDYRNRWVVELRQRFAHQVDEGSQVFVEGAANARLYDKTFDNNGQKSSSHGFDALAGYRWDYSGVTYLEAAIGYLYQSYDDPNLPNVKGPNFRLRAIWNATGVVTLTAEANRSVAETTQAGVSGVLVSSYALKADWEAMYNLIVSAQAGFTNDRYRGSGRVDDTTTSSLRARWLINGYWYLNTALDHDFRNSTVTSGNYTDTRAFITLGVHL